MSLGPIVTLHKFSDTARPHTIAVEHRMAYRPLATIIKSRWPMVTLHKFSNIARPHTSAVEH